jgi:hypothetical protein
MGDAPLLVDEQARRALNQQLAQLTIKTPERLASSPLAETRSKGLYKIEANVANVKEVMFDFEREACTFVLKDEGGKHLIKCGYQEWVEGTTSLFNNQLHSLEQPTQVTVFAKSGWKNEHVFEMTWCFVNTLFIDTISCIFEGMRIQLKRTVNTDQGGMNETFYGNLVK